MSVLSEMSSLDDDIAVSLFVDNNNTIRITKQCMRDADDDDVVVVRKRCKNTQADKQTNRQELVLCRVEMRRKTHGETYRAEMRLNTAVKLFWLSAKSTLEA